jgi:RNA 3'-terminal phosphate cyclase (ATP)
LKPLILFPGLKAQHVAGIKYLAEATAADLAGCTVGSKSFTFNATQSPLNLANRNIKIRAESAASILLVFQSIFPFLLFAGDDSHSPISVVIHGGTNVSFSLSFEYLDQVLLPALERFGVQVERKLEYRGWSLGSRQIGSAKLKFIPLAPGQSLKAPLWPTAQGAVTNIDASIIVPKDLQQLLKESLLFEIDLVFPGVEVNFLLVEDSRDKPRIYALLVAHTSTGLRFGRDWLYNRKTKGKHHDKISTEVAQMVVDQLDIEIRKGGLVDEYLQDQLVIFQALAEGTSSIPGSSGNMALNKNRVDQTDEPFGDGSTHTTTARWVVSQLLTQTTWIDEGRVCKGAAWKAAVPT